MEDIVSLVTRVDLWIGVAGGILATLIIGLITYAFRSSLNAITASFNKGAENDKVISTSLENSNQYTQFAYGIAQARALRFFILAALLGAIVETQVAWALQPLAFVLTIASIFFLFLAFKWLNKIETKGIQILQGQDLS